MTSMVKLEGRRIIHVSPWKATLAGFLAIAAFALTAEPIHDTLAPEIAFAQDASAAFITQFVIATDTPTPTATITRTPTTLPTMTASPIPTRNPTNTSVPTRRPTTVPTRNPTPKPESTAISKLRILAGSPNNPSDISAGNPQRVTLKNNEGWFSVTNPGSFTPTVKCVEGCSDANDFTVEIWPPEKINTIVTTGDRRGSTKLEVAKSDPSERTYSEMGNRNSAGGKWLGLVTETNGAARDMVLEMDINGSQKNPGKCITYQDGAIPQWTGCENDRWWAAVPANLK